MTDKCLLCNTLLAVVTGRGQFCQRCGSDTYLRYWDKCNDCGYLVLTTDKDFTLCGACTEKRKQRYMSGSVVR